MKLDLTGIIDDGGYTVLNPGRYDIETKSPWYASESDAGNMVLRIPFVVLSEGEFKGSANSYFHTIMTDGDAEKVRTNKLFTLRLFATLGVLSEEDRGDGGALEIEFEFGNKDEKGNVEVHSVMVNGARRSLGGRYGIAVVVVDANRKDGVSIKTIDPKGKPVASNPQPQASPPAQTTQSKANKLF